MKPALGTNAPPEASSQTLEIDLSHLTLPADPINLEPKGTTSQKDKQPSDAPSETRTAKLIQKLHIAGRKDLAAPLEQCCKDTYTFSCSDCGHVHKFRSHCDVFYCPRCGPRQEKRRTMAVEFWLKRISFPKHVVLTVRNWNQIDRGRITWLKDCLAKLRRRKVTASWTGGFYSIETTNKGKGWHCHIHLVVDCKWIDVVELTKSWCDIIGQSQASVHVSAAKSSEIAQYVGKYATKSAEIETWSADDIVSWIEAMKGIRLFGTFGTLYAARAEWKAYLEELADNARKCPCCGSPNVCVELDVESFVERIQSQGKPTGPPNQPTATELFSLRLPVETFGHPNH